ncbi:MAG TPA: multifunctional CCA addition/repair protein [Gammaproteobacteria bacterium]|nr:multifunctional CCA addition/repair protein [Gammaproteobacteria bacterium]
MKVYEVGGAVRDALLGLAVKERDWVVVGASAEDLEAEGYRRVGKDFPVFLHPRTGEQYALARTERKIGPGYTGFAFDTSTNVTLEQDLARRDLTINAIARDESGELIDPWGGRADLEGRLLRHVSDAFREDPLRVLRVARFAARFHELGFAVAADTLALMRDIVTSGEIDALRPERVWQETVKALGENRPDVYFEVLRACGALEHVFPEVDALFGVPQPAQWHPEIDTGVHVMMALRCAARLSRSEAVRFAVLTHDLGKAATPKLMLPAHHGHEQRSVELLAGFCGRLPVPNRFRELAQHVARQHGKVHRAGELKPSTVLELIMEVDGLRQPERFEELLLACEADARGRTGLEDRPYPQAELLRTALQAARAVDAARVREEKKVEGEALGRALRDARLAAVKAVLRDRAAQPRAQS